MCYAVMVVNSGLPFDQDHFCKTKTKITDAKTNIQGRDHNLTSSHLPTSALTLLVGQQEKHLACKKLNCGVICLKRGADLRMAQLMPLPLTVSCFSNIQTGFAFLVPAHPGSPGKRAIKRVCVCVCAYQCSQDQDQDHPEEVLRHLETKTKN